MTADLGPQHGSMSATEIRDARATYDALREGTYWQAAAVNASYADADAVVRQWRRSPRDWAELVKCLDALADGWGS